MFIYYFDRYYLQALRYLYVLTAEPHIILSRNIYKHQSLLLREDTYNIWD